MLKATLTPNRSDTPRFINLVLYRREGDRVIPYRYRSPDGQNLTSDNFTELRYHEIALCSADLELVKAWGEHVRSQEITEAPTFEEQWLAHVRSQHACGT